MRNFSSEKSYIKAVLYSKEYAEASFEQQKKMLDDVLDKKLEDVFLMGLLLGEYNIKKQLDQIKYTENQDQ